MLKKDYVAYHSKVEIKLWIQKGLRISEETNFEVMLQAVDSSITYVLGLRVAATRVLIGGNVYHASVSSTAIGPRSAHMTSLY